MISINKLPQAKKRLEEDLQRLYHSAFKRYIDEFSEVWDLDVFPEQFLYLRDKTEDEIIEYMIEEAQPDLCENEREKLKLEREEELKESPDWKSLLRVINVISRQWRYTSAIPKIFATSATLLYDVFAHSILFSNWRWKDEEFDLKDLDLQLSPKEVCDRLFDCNPDVVSVLINKLEGCSIADRETLQDAFEAGQREVFVKSLKGLSVSDYNSLVFCASCLYLEDVFISFDIEKIDILQNHIDFGNQIRLNLSTLNTAIDFTKYHSSDKGSQPFESYCDLYEPILDSMRDSCIPVLKMMPKVLELIKPCPFPFERKYLDDLLINTEVKALIDELPEDPFENEMTPEDQRLSVVTTEPEGEPTDNKKTPGRWPEKWFKGAWTEEEFKEIIDSKIYPFIKGELNDFVFDDETSKSESKKQTAITAAAAAIILYGSEKSGLPTKSPITTCSLSMSRTLSAPKSSVSVYLKALNQWYHVLLDISKDVRRSKEALTIVDGWKKTDLIRGTFIGHNFKKLQHLINNTAFLLGQALDIKTDLVYMATGGAYDRALYMASEYDEKIQIDKNGHRHNTAIKMSDGADED